MFTRDRFMVVIAVVLLGLLFFIAKVETSSSALAPASGDARLSGSDYFERHSAELKADVNAGSDYFERHPAEQKLANYAGSDWIERHPTDVIENVYAGSDYFERHSDAPKLDVTAGSDYFERHPTQSDTGLKRYVRQPGRRGR